MAGIRPARGVPGSLATKSTMTRPSSRGPLGPDASMALADPGPGLALTPQALGEHTAHLVWETFSEFLVSPELTRLVQTLEIVQGLVDVPLSIDSSVSAAIEAALKVAKGRPLVNSVTGEEEKLEAILPLVKKYDVPVVAISNDETGISEDPDVRFEVAKKIVQRAADYGIPAHDIVVDPLVMPIGAMGTAGRQVFALLRRLRDELKVNTTCGLSNISFGLPHRHGINAAFIPMVIGAGMTSAIMNPCRPQEMEMVRGANVLAGTDRDCMNWIRTYKDHKPGEHAIAAPVAPSSSGESAGGRRRGGREARMARG